MSGTAAARVRRAGRVTRVRLPRHPRELAHAWRSSLQLRVIATTLAIGLVTLAALGGSLSDRIRDGLFTERINQVLDESARSTQQAQDTFDSSTATTSTEVQQRINDVVLALRSGGSGNREVFMLRAPGQAMPVLVTPMASDASLVPLISKPLRQQTEASAGQRWQSVGWASTAASAAGGLPVEPAVVVGQTVTVPVAGTYELYFLYSLQSEQERLAFLQRMLSIAGAALVVLLGTMTWVVTRQVVRPVRVAAQVAERLADGHLEERMPVRGQDELATLGRSFNEMAESLQEQIIRLEQLSALQRRFVSDVSHELRTPLTTIRMAGEVLHGARVGFEPAIKRSAELLLTQSTR